MRSPAIRAVLFDFGGVLTESPFTAFHAFERSRGLPQGFLQAVNRRNPGDNAWARFPSWSSDGKRLVFQKSTALQSPFELITVNVADGKPERLASAAGDCRHVRTSPRRAMRSTSRAGSMVSVPCIDCP